MSAYFYFSVLLLSALLFLPATKLIWVLSVRRLAKNLGRDLEETEIAGQKSRARFIALLVVLAFSYFFNLALLGVPNG